VFLSRKESDLAVDYRQVRKLKAGAPPLSLNHFIQTDEQLREAEAALKGEGLASAPSLGL
jgi:hypothetical protein